MPYKCKKKQKAAQAKSRKKAAKVGRRDLTIYRVPDKDREPIRALVRDYFRSLEDTDGE